MPFQLDLTRSGLQHRWARTELIPFLTAKYHGLSIADVIANILLFVPFGFLLHSWRMTRQAPQSNGDLHHINSSVLMVIAF
jgi:glycopeptide antibiotics resistance protein